MDKSKIKPECYECGHMVKGKRHKKCCTKSGCPVYYDANTLGSEGRRRRLGFKRFATNRPGFQKFSGD